MNNQHDNAIRDYHRDQDQETARDAANRHNSSQMIRLDGKGYTICRPQATWCQ